MNEEHDSTNHPTEQWMAFQRVWGETFNKMMQLGFTFSPDCAPPDFMRQMRSGIFQALGHSWEQFLRSPEFMEGMKQSMDSAIAFRKMTNDLFSKVRHETHAVARDDIDAVMLTVRHMETRVLDRLDELAARLDDVAGHLNGNGSHPDPAAQDEPTPKTQPPKNRGKNPTSRS